MSTRTVKTHHNNNNNNNNKAKGGNNKPNFAKPSPSISSVKNTKHTIQQPNKKKLQTTTPKQGRKKTHQVDVEEDYYYQRQSEQVYAGPTFNNAPAPSALPIPAFNARGSPINYPQPLYHVPTRTFQQQSMDLMNLIAPQNVITAYELEKTNLALSEIQRGLRSMLKIES